ncbi:hypothetical protein HN954_01545 [bacterium]|jgi:hypothetical protein|nr:hypothetical protein [bacterium]MBT6831535.1 hypothetical protein [bacterium]MBT6996093.1 hypothetical protein [bacterium]MBT7772726.1 hypothetical protein [bacterium]
MKHKLLLAAAFLFLPGTLFALTWSTFDIPDKQKGSPLRVSDFNKTINTLRNVWYDDVAKNLGIGTSDPSSTLDVNGTFRIGSQILGTCDDEDDSGQISYYDDGDLGAFYGCIRTNSGSAAEDFAWIHLDLFGN